MTEPLRDAPRQPPRFVPTLTEVVPATNSPTPAVAEPASEPPVVELERVVQGVLTRLRPNLDRLVSEAVSQVVQEQMQDLHWHVLQAVEAAVQRAVQQALLPDR